MKLAKFICFFLILNYSISAYSMRKLPYILPEEKHNWILNVQIFDNLVVVFHKNGVSISKDSGENFFEAKLRGNWNQQNSDNLPPQIYITPKEQKIFIQKNGLWVSQENNTSFKKMDLPFLRWGIERGLSSIKSLRNAIYLTISPSFGHDTCDKNKMYISNDLGETFYPLTIGKEACDYPYNIELNNGLYVKMTTAFSQRDLYLSKDEGESFNPVSINDKGWAEIINLKMNMLENFKNQFQNLDFPEANYFYNQLHNGFIVKYNDPNFNSIIPQDNIAYSYKDQYGNKKYLEANFAPRLGGFTRSGKLFFSNFKEIWVE